MFYKTYLFLFILIYVVFVTSYIAKVQKMFVFLKFNI